MNFIPRIAPRAFTVVAAINLLVVSGCWSVAAVSADFVLVRDGKPTATIVIAEAATGPASFGAQELQYHIRRITGATLSIKTDREKVEGMRILVGPCAAASQFGLEERQFKDQEYLIRFLNDSLVLFGKGQATSYAVHDFLERFCGVRWYGPGESQMVLPETETLVIQPREIRRTPAFAWRTMLPEWGGVNNLKMGLELYDNPSEQEMDLFQRRLRLGGESYNCNHSLEGYYDRFWQKNANCPDVFVAAHPDWFAQGYSASELEGSSGRPPQMCFTNQGLVEQVTADARSYFDSQKAEPGAVVAGEYFALVPMDSGGGGWCRCPACQTQMDRDREAENHFDSSGGASDYWFAFVNRVAREVVKTHPGKYLSTLAYCNYSYHPRRIRLEPNVSVQMCLHTRNWWAPGMEENELRFYRDWVSHEKGRPLYVWLYYLMPEWSPGNERGHCFPGFSAHTLARQIKMFARDGIRGAFIEGVSDQVDTYVTVRLLDDPSLDVDVLLEEFFTRYYGRAGGPMKRLYFQIEEVFSNPTNYPEEVRKDRKKDFFQTEEIAWRYLGTEARMAELGAMMDEAGRLAVDDAEIHRVALFRKAIWDRMVEGRKQYLTRQPNKLPLR